MLQESITDHTIMPASLALSGQPDDSAPLTSGHRAIRIAIIDGVVDRTHPCLESANLEEVPIGEVTLAASDHGTQVASILLGQAGTSVEGIVPGCTGVSIPIFGRSGQCSQLDLARAIDLAQVHQCHVINISGGRLDHSGQAHPLLAGAIDRCAKAGVVIVAAAGNDGCNCVHVPAAVDCVLAVGASGVDGKPLKISNWGKPYRHHGILAPGENLITATSSGQTALATGTSFATAVTSGLIAKLLSEQIHRSETPDPAGVHQAILDTLLLCPEPSTDKCNRFLMGSIHLEAASQSLTEGNPMNEKESVLHTATIPPPQAGLMSEVEVSAPQPNPPQAVELSSDSKPCGCQNKGPAQLVFALGNVGFAYSSEARQDSFRQVLRGDPTDPRRLLDHLAESPWNAESLIWTLTSEEVPIYAIAPTGPFAANTYSKLAELVQAQLEGEVKHVSIPGVIRGSVQLANGYTLPAIEPDLRGIFGWRQSRMVDHLLEHHSDLQDGDTLRQDIHNFLRRVYYELRNLGVTSADRAVNYAATNAFQACTAFVNAIGQNLKLDKITVEKSPICRPESDCWDVTLAFFRPERRLEEAKLVERMTVDVSDVVPVSVGDTRSWHVH